ncbi:MAG: flavin reductase family protein [Alphaproteobacteria bacterium]
MNVTTLELAKACDYCGVKSGKNTDKIKEMNLEIEACKKVAAPMLSKAPISLECKVKSVTSFKTHDMFLAEIVNVNVDDRYLEEDGRLALEKAGLLAYVHGRYYTSRTRSRRFRMVGRQDKGKQNQAPKVKI